MICFKVGDRVLHMEYGPCCVTFIGTDYIGVVFDDARHAMFKKQATTILPYSEEQEAEWRAAIAADEEMKKEIDNAPWPESTFRFENEDVTHYLGSHWEPFYEKGVEEVACRLPEITRAALLATGFGDIHKPARALPESWNAGFHLAWPLRIKGAMLSVLIDNAEKQNRLCSFYPFWAEGNQHHLVLKEVMVWKGGAEAQITASFGESKITFFDTHYLMNREWYERGGEYDFILTGIAYKTGPATNIELPLLPHPDQLAWEADIARSRGEEPPERNATMSLAGSAMFLQIPEWDKDDYSFRGTVKGLKPISDFLGQDGWLARVTVLRISGNEPEDVDLDIVITSRAWEGETPPKVGSDIDGSLWLQGYLWQVKRGKI